MIGRQVIVINRPLSKEELLQHSGITGGENLVRMKTEKIREKMLEELLCIDDVTIKKDYFKGRFIL